MKKTSFVAVYLLSISILILSSSCQREEFEYNTIPSEIRSGKLSQIEGSTIDNSDLEIISLAGSSDIDGEGNFSLESIKADKFQQLLVLSKTTENVVYIGLFDPETKKLMVNDTSTILSLLMANPHLMNTSQVQRKEYLEAVKKNPKFPQILSTYKQSIRNDAEKAFDFESNPVFYQTAVQIMMEAVESLQSDSKSQDNVLLGGDPTITDAAGNDIVFVNPRHVFYGAGIYSMSDPSKILNTVTVKRQTAIIKFHLDLRNFIDINEPALTTYDLKDGQYRIYLNRGLDFTKILQWNDPAGRATICNTGQIILYTLDVFAGFSSSPNIEKLSKYINISPAQIYSFTRAITSKNLIGFSSSLFGLMKSNAEGIVNWIYHEVVDDAKKSVAKTTVKTFAGIFENVSFALKLVSLANGPGPMLYDLIFSPEELNFYITQKNGVITSNKENKQPEAIFNITPPAGIIGTSFKFDASLSKDDSDELSKLMFRWDFESDGTWDTDWSNGVIANHSYTESASYIVTLSVKDSEGLTGNASHTLNVGGGAGTASHVKLFMDKNPWSSDAMIRMLKANGFTEGTGKNTYEIVKSSGMASVSLLPGEDLVIISNDQEQAFYNNYAASQIRFTAFVNYGGAMLWEACDKGWNNGSMATAGLVLPGNVKSNLKYDMYNYVTDKNLPLVSELPNKMDHNYASHEFFTDLPDGTTIYCVDSNNNPTLIEFNFGDGWIIITGQPLEHQFDRVYGAVDMGKLLPGIVSYFTGSNSPKNSDITPGSIRDNKPSTPEN